MIIKSKTSANPLRVLGRLLFLSALVGLPGVVQRVAAQTGPEPEPYRPDSMPLYHMTVTPATSKAINYRNLTGSTRIGFRGTVLSPMAEGLAKVQNRGGAMAIKAKFEKMEPASKFGHEFQTYVMWAVTPVGRPFNLGEVIVQKSGRASLEAHSNLQTFGLIVTAEPHFAVSQMSQLVVMENAVTKDTRGQVEEVEARYELLPRSSYTLTGNPADLAPEARDRRINPYVPQAEVAFRIAQASQADRFAPAEFQKTLVLKAQLDAEKKKWKKPAIILARQVVQQAEDARLVSVKAQELAQSEQEKQAAEAARRDVESARKETETTRIQSEAARLAALQETQRAKELAGREAERAKLEASREVSAEKLALRRKLKDQLSRLLETRETERGVVVSLADLLFPTGKANLLPSSREKLAKIAGILLAYPGVKVTVEGHTDATGSAAFNRKLSHRRADGVRAFLIQQGLAPGGVYAQGLGSEKPVDVNDTPMGRQQNRRVELILTGGAIGF